MSIKDGRWLQAPGGHKLDFLGEVDWLNGVGIRVPYKIVAFAHLARDDTEAVINALVSSRSVDAGWREGVHV
jgi:hypothetical protein